MATISGQRTKRFTSGSWKPTLSGRVGLGLLDLVGLDDVALLEVLVPVDPDAALESGQHFVDIVLEALETLDLALVDRFVVSQDLGGRPACDLAVHYPRPGDNAQLRDLDRREHFGATLPDLDEGRLVETLDGPLDVVGDVEDDVVAADVHLLPLGGLLSERISLDVKGDDERVRYRRQQDVRLGHGADALEDDLDLHLGILDLQQRALERLDRAVAVSLEDQVEVLDGPLPHLRRQVGQRDAARLRQGCDAILLGPLTRDG